MVSRRRHIAKALSWRVVGTLDTMLVSWLVTGDPVIGISIGIIEVISKTGLYYAHERAWYRLSRYGVETKVK